MAEVQPSGILAWPSRMRENWVESLDNLNKRGAYWPCRAVHSAVGGLFTNVVDIASGALSGISTTATLPIKYGIVKPLSWVTGSTSLKQLDEAMGGICYILTTVLRTFKAAIAAAFSATLGFLVPSLNVKLHHAFNFAKAAAPATAQVSDEEEGKKRAAAIFDLLRAAQLQQEKAREALRNARQQATATVVSENQSTAEASTSGEDTINDLPGAEDATAASQSAWQRFKTAVSEFGEGALTSPRKFANFFREVVTA